MDFQNGLLILSVLICCFIYQGSSLECYECSNLSEPGCGVTWELSEKESKQYLTKCEGETAACRKIMSKDVHKGQTVVLRSCWTTTSSNLTLDDDFLSCHEMSESESCYCTKDKEDGEPCNGRQPLLVYWALLSALVILVRLVPY